MIGELLNERLGPDPARAGAELLARHCSPPKGLVTIETAPALA